MGFDFETFYDNDGRKFAKFNGEIIKMEQATQDIIDSVCRKNFSSYKVQYNEKNDFVIFFIYIPKNVDSSKFQRELEASLDIRYYYDIIRF